VKYFLGQQLLCVGKYVITVWPFCGQRLHVQQLSDERRKLSCDAWNEGAQVSGQLARDHDWPATVTPHVRPSAVCAAGVEWSESRWNYVRW